jgi:hypothetical protein
VIRLVADTGDSISRSACNMRGVNFEIGRTAARHGREHMRMLRLGLAMLGVLGASGLSSGCSSPSVAKYPYCLMTMDGERDCRYASREECEVTRSGVGGSCDPSPYYTGAAPSGTQAGRGSAPPNPSGSRTSR